MGNKVVSAASYTQKCYKSWDFHDPLGQENWQDSGSTIGVQEGHGKENISLSLGYALSPPH